MRIQARGEKAGAVSATEGSLLHVSQGLSVQGSAFKVQGFGFRVSGFGFRVQGSGFRV